MSIYDQTNINTQWGLALRFSLANLFILDMKNTVLLPQPDPTWSEISPALFSEEKNSQLQICRYALNLKLCLHISIDVTNLSGYIVHSTICDKHYDTLCNVQPILFQEYS